MKPLDEIILDLIEFIRPHIRGIGSILDIGTGTSIPIHIIVEHFPDVRYDTVDIADMRQRKELPFLLYNGKELPFATAEFDVSLLNETLHHCTDPGAVLAEARRVSESVYLIEHFPDPGAGIDQMAEDEREALQNFKMECSVYHPFTEDSLGFLMEEAGLEVFEKTEVPYFGTRKIKKILFKLR